MNFHLPVGVAHNHARLISRICHICTHIHITCATTSNDAHDVDRGKRSYSFYPDDVNELSELPALIPKAEPFFGSLDGDADRPAPLFSMRIFS